VFRSIGPWHVLASELQRPLKGVIENIYSSLTLSISYEPRSRVLFHSYASGYLKVDLGFFAGQRQDATEGNPVTLSVGNIRQSV
jgi:hypothetical protein